LAGPTVVDGNASGVELFEVEFLEDGAEIESCFASVCHEGKFRLCRGLSNGGVETSTIVDSAAGVEKDDASCGAAVAAVCCPSSVRGTFKFGRIRNVKVWAELFMTGYGGWERYVWEFHIGCWSPVVDTIISGGIQIYDECFGGLVVGFGGGVGVLGEFDDGRGDVNAAKCHSENSFTDDLAVIEAQLSLDFFSFSFVLGSKGEFKVGEVGGVTAHGEGFVSGFFIRPAMVFSNFLDIGFTADLIIVASLLNVHSVEAFDNAKVIELVGHVLLDLITDAVSDLDGLGADEEIVDLAENSDEAGCLFMFVI
jgi:hypothetical protein